MSSDEENHGSKYLINNQYQPVIINNPLPNGPLTLTSNAHFYNSYSPNYDAAAATQNNTYMRPGHGNQMGMEELSNGGPSFSQSPVVYYPHVPVHPHITEGTRMHRVRAHHRHHHHPYHPNPNNPSSSSSSASMSSWAIRQRTPPQPEVVFNFNHQSLVEDPMVGASSISISHVPSNEPPTHLPTRTLCQTPTPTTPTARTNNSNSHNNDDDDADAAALNFAQSAFPTGTPDFARKQAEMYSVLTSKWKLNNEFEPNADTLLRFATKEADGFWRCAFYENGGRRCERSLTERSRQIVEHIRRHIKLKPYVCDGQPCPSSINGCGKRYSSGDPLRKHRDGNLKGESICDLCGKTLLPGNIMRHLNNSCRETGH